MTAFSVLDQSPMRRGGAPGHALRDTLALARHVDGLGFSRYWVAEHHSVSGAASSAPEVLIGHVAAATTQVRVGSGAVLLPNHRPLHVAEQFRTLEALHPGRIDLGIGRSEGALDEATVRAFARPQDNGHGAGFERQLDELLAFGGARPLPDGDPLAGVRAVPTDVPLPPVVLLGSSVNSARTAARKGLPYGFAAHTNPDAAAEALELYREGFVPHADGDRPWALLALKVVVGADDEHARTLAASMHLSLVQLRAGGGAPLIPGDEALAHRFTEAERRVASEVDQRADVTGGPEHVRRELERHVAATGADEVLVISTTFDPADRMASFDRLAAVIGLAATPAGR